MTRKYKIPSGTESRTEVRQKKKKNYKKRVYYSFVTIVLIVFLAQISIGAGLNIAKCISLNFKYKQLEDIHTQAKKKSLRLKEELEKYNSHKGLEALARNRLKMAGKDEVLVIIKDTPTQESE